MYVRFPELVPPEISWNPTADEVESGEWCFPDFRPDESNVTRLNPDSPVVSQFAGMTPRHLWLQNDRQTIVAVSSAHIPSPADVFYDDLRSLFDQFDVETKGRERAALKEGRLWSGAELTKSDAEVITDGGDALYLQLLAHRSGIECLSAEPVSDKDILAVMHHWPELKRAAVMYVKMRMLPQAYKRQQQDPPYCRGSILDYFRNFMDERQNHHGRSWTGNHLYSINPFTGPGCLNAIGLHLTKAHGLYNDQGRSLPGYELAEGPKKEVVDQIFRCTNSPVFHAGDIASTDLCAVQQVAVLVNRLRDRRIAYLLADLSRRAVSYFWMSGPLHYEALVPGLRSIAAERGLASRNLQAELGLFAIQAADEVTNQPPNLRVAS